MGYSFHGILESIPGLRLLCVTGPFSYGNSLHGGDGGCDFPGGIFSVRPGLSRIL